jgi:threonyl-tRNA synthetase
MVTKGAALEIDTSLQKKHRRLRTSETPHIGQKKLYVTSGHYTKYGAIVFNL